MIHNVPSRSATKGNWMQIRDILIKDLQYNFKHGETGMSFMEYSIDEKISSSRHRPTYTEVTKGKYSAELIIKRIGKDLFRDLINNILNPDTSLRTRSARLEDMVYMTSVWIPIAVYHELKAIREENE